MKLLNCLLCHDIVLLRYTTRACLCGQSMGRYRSDGVFAEFTGTARILGLSNRDYVRSTTEPVIPWVSTYRWFPIVATPEHHVFQLSKEEFERACTEPVPSNTV
jgi:hypothetical protein